jgi:hypothetical protein
MVPGLLQTGQKSEKQLKQKELEIQGKRYSACLGSTYKPRISKPSNVRRRKKRKRRRRKKTRRRSKQLQISMHQSWCNKFHLTNPLDMKGQIQCSVCPQYPTFINRSVMQTKKSTKFS